MYETIIIFLAKYLIYIMIGFTAILIWLDLWKRTSSRLSIIKRIKQIKWRKVGFIILAFLLAFLVAQLFHLIPVEQYRPYQIMMTLPLIIPSADTPFPSDHVMIAFSLVLAVIFMTRYKKIGLIGGLFMFIGVAMGRILALVHSPLDIFGGILCALIGAGVWYYLYYRETPKNLPKDLKKLWIKIKQYFFTASANISRLIRRVKR